MAFQSRREDHKSFPAVRCENLSLLVAKHNDNVDDWNQNEHEAKDKALSLMASFKFPAPAAEAYKQACLNRQKAVESRGDCESFEIEASTRVLLGTGNASVFEFGFNLLHPWGVPYISGTSLKGLASSYLSRHGGEEWMRTETAVKSAAQVEFFGGVRPKETKDKSSYIGVMVFHDAWMAPWSGRAGQGDWFDEDIITPHYPGYYGEKRPPDGTDNPVPIKVAALRPGLKFTVTIQGPGEYRALVREVLVKALAEEGIGGKTAVGYGRFAALQTAAEKAAGSSEAIKNIASIAELAAFYKGNKSNRLLRRDFRAAMENFGYSAELKGMWESLRPLAALAQQVENGEIKDLKTLNVRFKAVKSNIENWVEDEGIAELAGSEDGRKLHSAMSKKWPAETAAGGEIKVVRDLTPAG